MLERRQLIVYTDNKPITNVFQQKNEKASPRQLPHLQYISEFSIAIHHINGKKVQLSIHYPEYNTFL